MINKRIIIFICLTPSLVFANDFKCRHYDFKEANTWLCSHLQRGFSQKLMPDSISPENILIDHKGLREIEILLRQAEKFYEQGNYPKVEQNYRKIIKAYRHYAPVWIKLAQFYSDLNREHDALQTLHQALTIIPGNADIYFETGLVQVRLRLFSEAVTSLAKAAIKAPENSHYSYVYAIALNSSQRPYKAIDVLLQAHQRQPDNLEILVALFSINHDMNNHSEALVFAHKILLIEPDNESIQHYVIKFEKK